MKQSERESRKWIRGDMKAASNLAAAAKSIQSCLTLCDPIDSNEFATYLAAIKVRV